MDLNELKELYEKYAESVRNEKTDLLSFFRGWLGMRSETAERDIAFLEAVSAFADKVSEEKDGVLAYGTAEFILQKANEAETDHAGRCIGAATVYVGKLLSFFDDGQKEKLLSLLKTMPRDFMLDGQIKLKKELSQK